MSEARFLVKGEWVFPGRRDAFWLQIKLVCVLLLVGLVCVHEVLVHRTGLFHAVLALQVTYTLAIFWRGAWLYPALRQGEAQPAVPEAALPSISILIPAHNEELVIVATIQKALAQVYPRFEVIVVDDHSTDRTADLVSMLPVTLVQRRDEPLRGKSVALNDGLRAASGEVICVLDADTLLEPTFLRSAATPLVMDPGLCAVQAQVRISNHQVNIWTRAQEDEFAVANELCEAGRLSSHRWAMLKGNGQLIRREALEAIGAWRHSLVDDLDLTIRLLLAGCGRIAHCPRAVVWQEGVLDLPTYVRQRTRWAEGMLRSLDNYGRAIATSAHLSWVQKLEVLYWLCLPLFIAVNLTASTLVVQALLGGQPLTQLVANNGLVYAVLLLNFVGFSATFVWKREGKLDIWPGLRLMVYLQFWAIPIVAAFRNLLFAVEPVWVKTARSGGSTPSEAMDRPAPALVP